MRLTNLHIENFRAIRRFTIEDLSDFIVIAGPNGCGKSCVFDAIRLLKSVYGGYQPDEWMQWFGEFQIDINDRSQLVRLFRDPEKPLSIEARVELSQPEKDYLNAQAEQVLEPLVWAQITGQNVDAYTYSSTMMVARFRHLADKVAAELARQAVELRASLSSRSFPVALSVRPNGTQLETTLSRTMEAVFRTYDPERLGIIDYHSATRNYQREQIGGVNLDVTDVEARRRTQSLYNWQQKYTNVKTELAATYIRDLISRDAGAEGGHLGLNEAMKELFQTFFPDKEYLGVRAEASGTLSFPVRVRSGQIHDINELSSGEKEVVYGYLRLRSSTPKHSTILLDEPELHLNPGLLQGFPDFYHRNIGMAYGNQLWLVTHSDTLLRQAVGNGSYSVFHMTNAATETEDSNQALPVVADDELERATIDLVGDLATYRPQAKVILFEGGGDTEVDVWMTGRLFPDVARRVNLISGGGKRRVADLYEVLSQTAERVGMTGRFFAITDRDTSPYVSPPAATHRLQWDVYHIENFLLHSAYIQEAISGVMQQSPFPSPDDVDAALADAAASLIPSLTAERLIKETNDRIVGAITIGGKPHRNSAADAILPSIEASYARLEGLKGEVVDQSRLESRAAEIEGELNQALADGIWVKDFPGRRVLQTFVGRHLTGVSYEGFRNLIIDKMVDSSFKPEGMAEILRLVMEA